MIDSRLITFLTLCKTRNFTKAAELLNLTQPAVTKHIKALEDHYNAPLFIRKGKSIELTPEGKILLEYTKVMELQTILTERKIKNSSRNEKRYTIGATLTIGEFVLPSVLAEYKNNNPSTDIIMQVYNTEIITSKLLNGEIDLGIVEGPFDKDKLLFRTINKDELVFTVSPESNYSDMADIELEEILKSKLILREKGSGTRSVLEEKLISLGINLNRLKPYMELGSIGAIKSLVELNLGTTIISRTAVNREVQSGSLVTIPVKGVMIEREFNFIYLPESPKEFLDSFISYFSLFAS